MNFRYSQNFLNNIYKFYKISLAPVRQAVTVLLIIVQLNLSAPIVNVFRYDLGVMVWQTVLTILTRSTVMVQSKTFSLSKGRKVSLRAAPKSENLILNQNGWRCAKTILTNQTPPKRSSWKGPVQESKSILLPFNQIMFKNDSVSEVLL